MNQPSKKKIPKIFSPEHDKLWMILLPIIAICCCVLILAPQISALVEYIKAGGAAETPAISANENAGVRIASDTPSLQTQEWDACAPDERHLKLTATSSERDMRVVVRDDGNNVVTGEQFSITVTSPAGDTAEYKTGTDGSCYIVELSPGEYTVSMGEAVGYAAAEPIKCAVNAKIEYVPIENISQVIDIVDYSDISPDEVKTPEIVPEQSIIIPEVINTPAEADSVSEAAAAEQEVPVTDSLGHQLYSYTVNLGPNGYILYRGTNQESDVLPVDENGDNVPEYGLRYESAETAVSQTESVASENTADDETAETDSAAQEEAGYYISVALFNADNTPVELYAIDAVPLTEQVGVNDSIGGWKKENGHTYYYGSDGQKEVGLKKIDGKLYYFNERGEKASSLGIDVSCFNGSINWNSVKASGIDFVIIRAGGRGWSSGLVYEDTFLREYMTGARNAGLKVGVYFYSTAVNTTEAVQEASVVIEKLKGAHLDYPVYIDMEFSGDYPNGRADLLSTAERVDIANAFCRTIMSSGYAAGIYASEYYMASCMDYRSVAQYSYWLANYTSDNAMPSFSGRYDIWQFTNCGQLSGISGTVDFNVIF